MVQRSPLRDTPVFTGNADKPLWSLFLHPNDMRRMLLSKPVLRNITYTAAFLTTLYAVYFITSSNDAFPYLPNYQGPSRISQERANQVKSAFVYAYNSYEQYAAPHDELRPGTRVGSDQYNGWGVTAFDSLDTMLLMDLKDEYRRALRIVKDADFSRSSKDTIPYFETVIRYLGGLLSAYAISSDRMLLDRAEELAAVLDSAFNTSSGLACYSINTVTGELYTPDSGVLAEFASLQLEYTYLAKLTGNPQYLNRSETVMNVFMKANLSSTGGMLPIRWDLSTGEPRDYHLSVGAQADSTHEYLLKLYLLTGQTDERSLILYLQATTQIISQLLYLTPKRNLLYVTDTSRFHGLATPTHTFEHLSCFLPGLLALGVHTLPLDRLDHLGIRLEHLGNETIFGDAGKAYHRLSRYNLKDLHMWAAEGLAQTCYLTYADSATGLGPDEMQMDRSYGQEQRGETDHNFPRKKQNEAYLWIDAVDKWIKTGRKGKVPGLSNKGPVYYTEDERLRGTGKGRDYAMRKTEYLLRPETVESLFILWKTTGNPKWREWGWNIFQAIENQTKTNSGYAFVRNVDAKPPSLGNAMPSFFLAETLKYLYLLFHEEDLFPLDKWVFNTEAHPFPVFQWTAEEKIKFSTL